MKTSLSSAAWPSKQRLLAKAEFPGFAVPFAPSILVVERSDVLDDFPVVDQNEIPAGSVNFALKVLEHALEKDATASGPLSSVASDQQLLPPSSAALSGEARPPSSSLPAFIRINDSGLSVGVSAGATPTNQSHLCRHKHNKA